MTPTTMSPTTLTEFHIEQPDRAVWPWLTRRAKAFAVWRQNQEDVRILAAMDDRQLRDIGLSRGEIYGIGRHF